MKFTRCFHLHLGNILYKYGLNCSLDNKVINLYLTVGRRVRRTSHTFLLYFPRGMVKCFVYSLFILASTVSNSVIYLLSKSSYFKYWLNI